MLTFNEVMMSLQIGMIYGIVAVGIYLTSRIIYFPDVTCDGSFVLGSAASSIIIKANYSPWLALIMAMLGGIVAGLSTGLLNTCFRVTNLLSGILVTYMLYSVNLHIMQGTPNIALFGLPTVFSYIHPLLLLMGIGALICTILYFVLMTDFGLALRSIGQNPKLAQNNGINVKGLTVVGLALANAFIALGGALFSQYQGFADIGGGMGTIVVGLASVMIGERLINSYSLMLQLISCFIGAIAYNLLISFALHSEILGLQTQDLNLITGTLVIAIMYFSRRRPC